MFQELYCLEDAPVKPLARLRRPRHFRPVSKSATLKSWFAPAPSAIAPGLRGNSEVIHMPDDKRRSRTCGIVRETALADVRSGRLTET